MAGELEILRGKRCVVTGGAGFIGSRLRTTLERITKGPVISIDNYMYGPSSPVLGEHDYNIDLAGANKADQRVLLALLRQADIVFHMASMNLKDCQVRDKLAYWNNIQSTVRVLRMMWDGIIIFSSSASVYGNTSVLGATEGDSVILNKTIYGDTKFISEQLISNASKFGHISGISLRYGNVYGPGQRVGKAYTDVITTMMRDALDGRDITVRNPAATYDFVHVDDVCAANLLAAANALVYDYPGRVFNIGAGRKTTIKDLALIIKELVYARTKKDVGIIVCDDTPNPDLVHTRVLNCGNANALLNFYPTKHLRGGLSEVLEWVLSTT